MERETGIEPATNSLEGCDSTTELLPPTRSLTSPTRAAAGRPADAPPRSSPLLGSQPSAPPANLTSSARHPKLVAKRSGNERKMVAREGLEPSKPLGRQIYSLLRLTASLPRQLSVFGIRVFYWALTLRMPTELAKGFEPPTC